MKANLVDYTRPSAHGLAKGGKMSKNMYFENIENLWDDIQEMLAHKKNKSKNFVIPDNITQKAKRILNDLVENHDNAWAVEIFRKRRNKLGDTVLIYRGRKIDGYEFWSNVYCFAKSLIGLGIKQGDEIPVMISNCPEFIYTIAAANLCGIVPNIVGTWFSKDYLNEIFTNSNSKYAFVSDDINESIIYAIESSENIEKAVVFSLVDSLPRNDSGEVKNPFAEIDEQFGHFVNHLEKLINSLSKPVIDRGSFVSVGNNINQNIIADSTLDSPSIITYTSGTTKPGYPKGCLHSNGNYMSLARFKEYGNPTIKNFISLAHLPSYTETVLTCIYTDSLNMGWPIALEPYFELDFYPYSLIINEPCLTVETPEYEKYVAKKLETEWKDVKMPYRVAITIAGQTLSPGLERYLNNISRKHKYGVSRLPFPLAPVTMTIGGGTTENGGIFYTLFKGLNEKKLPYILTREHMNLKYEKMVEFEIFDQDGNVCLPYKRGTCYVISPTNQIGYVKPEFNEGTKMFKNGKTWVTTGTPAYKDRFGLVRMLDRPNTDIILSNGSSYPLYKVLDPVQKDTVNIMEAYLVKVEDATKYIIHIEKQPSAKLSDSEIVHSIKTRLQGRIPEEILSKLFFRFRSFEEGFPVNGTGKTDLIQVAEEGFEAKICIPYMN